MRMKLKVMRAARFFGLALALAALGTAAAPGQPDSAPGAATAAMSGAGPSGPGEVYEGWALAYGTRTAVVLDYERVDAGRGVREAMERKADFGASELPLRGIELERSGLAQFPTYVSALVPVVNLPSVQPGALRLTGPLLAEILLGRVKKWNDDAIEALNPGLALPDLDIQVVYRADEAAHTQVLTRYLSKVSETWAKQGGSGLAMQWRAGVGAKNAESMISEVKRLSGAIGYLELNQAAAAKLATVQLQNVFGRFVAPEPATLLAAADALDWQLIFAARGSFDIDLTDMPGLRVWPLAFASYVVLPRVQERSERGRMTLTFFDWSLGEEGDKIAEKLGYVGLPARGKQYVRASLRRTFTDAGGEPLLR
jgi:phosphate transport system substrate-binding protein